MKKAFTRIVSCLLALLMMFAMLTGCDSGEAEEASVDAIVDAAVKAAMDAAVVPTVVTIEVDGKQITVEDAANKSVQQMLDQAGITVNEGDMICVPAHQTLTGNITIKVIRTHTVKLVAEGEEGTVQYVLTLNDGTVADALKAAGLELGENQKVDQELDKSLEDNMVITLSEEEVEEETEQTEQTKETKSSTKKASSTSSSKKSTKSTKPKSTTKATTKPKDTTPKKTIVKTEYYEDCDGSGHGVKVITYSDGTQKEVPY